MAHIKAIAKTLPMAIPAHVLADVVAIKAVNRGDASPEQQQRALNWIMKNACHIGGISFVENNPHLTSFNEGKRFIGLQLMLMITEPIESFKDK
jgi:hypothetical protein